MSSRRRTALSIALASSLALAACSPATPGSSGDDDGRGSVDTGTVTGASNLDRDAHVTPAGEAPELAEKVEAGELPPVEERMPENPPVIKGADGPGEYGGQMQLAMLDADDHSTVRRYLGYEPLVRWHPDWTDELQPGVARDWEASDDATEFTFYLNEGIRWSDGEPFTADDIVFAYDDVYKNKELTPGPHENVVAPDGSYATVEKIDDHTVKFTFDVPHGLFLINMARSDADGMLARYPKHYLSQFHPDYNENAEAEAEADGADSWVDRFLEKGGVALGTGHDARWLNSDLPVLNAWIIEQPAYHGNRVSAVRNPYYWKVDTDGNQLPFVDRVVFDVYADQEVIGFRAAAGEISYQDRHFDHDLRPLLAESMEQNGYDLIDVTSTDMNTLLVNFNLHHNDDLKREVFTNKDFRVGLSHAIDREEMIELAFFGQGEPWQSAPRKESPFYHEKLATQFTEHDVALANEHLDKVLPEKGANGMRLGPDGQPFTFSVDLATDRSIGLTNAVELIRGYWQEVGIPMEINTVDRDLRNERRDSGNFDAAIRDGSAGLQDAILRPRWYMPHGTSSFFAPLWGEYYLDNDSGLKPPEDSLAWKQWDLYDQIQVTADTDKQRELMMELLDVSAEAFWNIGVSSSANRAGVRKDGLMNAPGELYESSAFENPGPLHPASFWWAEGAGHQ
ncbi:MAG: ABC transporter substrate-binding protein [Mobilicoccus sp.]|nr:ABC transporter substrate-binding protein [Mobilicoccus sp.]